MPEAGGSIADDALIAAHPGALRARRAIEAPVHATTVPVASTRVAGPLSVGPWYTALKAFGLATLALFAFYASTVLDLWQEWGHTGTFAHGYFIFPISIWLVWRSRAQLATMVPRIQPLAIVPMVGCGVLWLAAHTARVHAVEQYAFVAMFPCLVWAVFGNEVTKFVLYPLVFLFFAVPAGDFLMPTLMDYTADFTVAALRLSGVPVFREGNYFTIPSGNWSVVEACSGLRYLIASITLGFLFAYLNYRATWRRVAFFAAAIVVPIVANWLRAYLIVMLAHTSGNKLATGVDHLVYGWLFFGLVMMLLFWVGNLWRDDDEPDPLVEPVRRSVDARAPASRSRAIGAMAAATFLVVAPWPAIGNVLERLANAPHPAAFAFEQIPGWQSTASFTKFTPHYLRSRSSTNETFSSDGRQVGLFVAYYSGQLDNGLLVTYENDVVLVTDKAWGSIAQRSQSLSIGGRDLPIVENVIKGSQSGGEQRLLTWRWYWINGRLTASKYMAKAYNAIDKMTGRGDDSAVVVLTTPIVNGSEADAQKALEAFAMAAEPQIATRLATIHDQARQ